LQIFEVAFTERELKQYEAAMMNRHDQKAILAYAEEKAEARGVKKNRNEIARNMLTRGFSVAAVLKATDLSRGQIRALSKA
jgi:predicted transposase/invertase (TIGR01784 family)